MYVLATAGHVDHGKSTLVRALTGMEPDRFAEEQRRGLTIDLGFAWTQIDGRQIALVDVPGHERLVPTMLAGVGSVPAVIFVVAADGGWMPQSQEHLDALDALDVRHGLLVISRCDLADPAPALQQARERLQDTSLRAVLDVAVSAVTDPRVPALRAALARLVDGLPKPQVDGPVRLWIDRVFTVKGAGTVVTGTLSSGTLRRGDRLQLGNGRELYVRGLQSLGRSYSTVQALARVAVNLRGASVEELTRGDALLTPGSHRSTRLVDVRRSAPARDLPGHALLHIGTAQVSVRVRPLDALTARLQLAAELPLSIGDLGLLRDPGRRQVLTGVRVLDVDPPPLGRRGAAAARARQLAQYSGEPDAVAELERRQVVRRSDLVAMGIPAAQAAALPGADPQWAMDPGHRERLQLRVAHLVSEHRATHPLEEGVPVEIVRQALGLPAQRLVAELVQPPLALVAGRVVDTRHVASAALPPQVARAVAQLREQLTHAPYAAPDAHQLRDLGLGPRELAAAVRVGALAKVADGIYLTPEALGESLVVLRQLPQPFTSSQARQAWSTSRRVALPLLEHLDRIGATRRLPDDTRVLLDEPPPGGVLPSGRGRARNGPLARPRRRRPA